MNAVIWPDLMYLAAKFIPQKKVAQALLDEGNVHAAMAKTGR